MDLRTGEIIAIKSLLDIKEKDRKFFVPLKPDALTSRQERSMLVSVNDHRSQAGKLLGSQRNLPCPCGSGIKLKKCCGR